MKKAKALIWAFFISIEVINAQSQIYFDKTFDYSEGLEFALDVLITDDSNYISLSPSRNLSTFDNSIVFSIYDFDGSQQDLKAYTKPGFEYYIGISGSLVKSMLNDGYYMGGSIDSISSGTSDALVVKFDLNGDTTFTVVIGDTSVEAFYNTTVTSDSGIALIGFRGPSTGPMDFYLVKVDLNGNVLWQQTYGGLSNDVGLTIFEAFDNKLVLGGRKTYSTSNSNPWIIITDDTGNVVNEKEFTSGALSCGGVGVFPTLDNWFLTFGCMDTTINSGEYSKPTYLGKMDTNFNFFWKTIFNHQFDNGIYICHQLMDSSIVFVGFQADVVPTIRPLGWIVKLDQYGNKLWEHTYMHDSSTWNYFADFQQTFDGGFIVTGSTNGPTGQDIWLVKLDSMGCLVPNCITNIGTIEVGHDAYELQVYPNPAASQATVLYNLPYQTREATLQVFDVTGRLIKQISLAKNANSISLDVNEWSGGIYLCNLLVDGERVRSVKLLVGK